MASKTENLDDERCGRRSGTDRRVRNTPGVQPERRRAERRSGSDRRTEPRG